MGIAYTRSLGNFESTQAIARTLLESVKQRSFRFAACIDQQGHEHFMCLVFSSSFIFDCAHDFV